MERIAIYARVSTMDRGQDPETQLRELRAWSLRLGGEIVAEYVDQRSGTRADRPALKKLLEAAHRREFDVVLVWALDRLSREGIAAMVAYLDRLKAAGVALKSHQESWLDTASPVSDLLLAVFAWVARQERERIRERVQAGVDRARAAGTQFGRPRVIVDASKVEKLLAEGVPMREVARRTGYARSTLRRRFGAGRKSTDTRLQTDPEVAALSKTG